MRRVTAVLSFLLAAGLLSSVRAEERPVQKKAQQIEQEVKTEKDRPAKKERAKAATGRVEDGVREFGRGLQGVMKEAGIGDRPAARKPEPTKGESKAAPAKPAPAKAKPVKPAPPAK